ncbi:MAG: MFS transporter [Desulfobacter sp.]|nr:MFS transporter [Desulfobacter sp.]
MTQDSKAFYGLISIATFTKLVMNISKRMIYPFAPEFARGLNVDLSAITSLIAVNQATGVLGPVGASFADKYGYKLLMLLSVGFLTIGTFAAGLIPMYSVLMIALFLTGLTKNIFDPSLQGFIGQHVPIEQRGRVIGITETAWAGSTLAGIPLAGILIERFSWQTPFCILGIFSLVCFFLILKFMPKDKLSPPGDKSRSPAKQNILSNWKTIVKNPQVLGILGFSFFMSLANDNLFVIYGAWLEKSYGLSLAAIGFGTIFIGISEILGEGCTSLFSDRIGLKTSVITGTALSAGAYLILPFADMGLGCVLAGLFLVFFCFEFTFVTSMSLSTELVPGLRASTMSAFYAVAGIGRVIGALCGGLIWTNHGLVGISLVSGFCTILALVSLLIGFSFLKLNTH